MNLHQQIQNLLHSLILISIKVYIKINTDCHQLNEPKDHLETEEYTHNSYPFEWYEKYENKTKQ